MYQNKVTLIGFLGSNPEARTNSPDFSVTTLSLATKSSYKKDGKYVSHTEWHRCVVFGKLSEFAKTLTKGAHVQVEGELRSREYDSKKTDSKRRVWEIRVASILKLDRAEKAAAEDQEHDESPQRSPTARSEPIYRLDWLPENFESWSGLRAFRAVSSPLRRLSKRNMKSSGECVRGHGFLFEGLAPTPHTRL